MNTKQRATLAKVYATPILKDILWADVESLFRATGGTVQSVGGSAVAVRYGKQRAIFHRPHPQPTIYVKDVERIRRFLERVGVKP